MSVMVDVTVRVCCGAVMSRVVVIGGRVVSCVASDGPSVVSVVEVSAGFVTVTRSVAAEPVMEMIEVSAGSVTVCVVVEAERSRVYRIVFGYGVKVVTTIGPGAVASVETGWPELWLRG